MPRIGIPPRRPRPLWRRWAWPALALISVVLAVTGCSTVRAALLLRDSLRPASELAADVEEVSERLDLDGVGVPVRVVRPVGEDGPLPGFVVVHGAAAGGAHDDRLVALARALAIRGATVAVPHLDSLSRFEMDAGDPGRVAAIASWLSARDDLVVGGRVALVGISVGGSYCLVAAADDAVSEHVSAVLAFGAYADLGVLIRSWLVDPPAGAPGVFDPVREGRQLVFLGNVERLVPEGDVAYARSALRALFQGTSPPAEPAGLSPATRRLLVEAASERPLEPAYADALLARMAAEFEALSPARNAAAPAAPVYLLHATSDPIVPVADATVLEAHLRAAGGEADVLVTDVFDHVNPQGGGTPSLFDAWPLLRFMARVLDDSGL